MTWFDKKYNEYVETKLKQIVEDERYNKKSKRTIQQQENDNGIVIIISDSGEGISPLLAA